MPISFAYLLALFAFVGMVLVLLGASLLLAVFPRCRSLAKRLAIGVMGSVAGVFAFQVAAAPIAIVMVWSGLLPVLLTHGSGPTANPAVIGVSIGTVVFATVLFASASVAGFTTGWSAATAVIAEGVPWRSFVSSHWLFRRARALGYRPYILAVALWLVLPWLVLGPREIRRWANSDERGDKVAGYMARSFAVTHT